MRKGSTVKGSLADRIRRYPRMPSGELSALLGVPVRTICIYRWHDANRERVRELKRDCQRRTAVYGKRTFDLWDRNQT